MHRKTVRSHSMFNLLFSKLKFTAWRNFVIRECLSSMFANCRRSTYLAVYSVLVNQKNIPLSLVLLLQCLMYRKKISQLLEFNKRYYDAPMLSMKSKWELRRLVRVLQFEYKYSWIHFDSWKLFSKCSSKFSWSVRINSLLFTGV